MRYIMKVIDTIEKVCLRVSVIAVLAIMLSTNSDLILRKFAHLAIFGLYEITEDYMMPALIFLSISHVYRRGGHVRVTLLEKYIPQRIKPALDKIMLGAGVAFFALMTVGGWHAFVEAWVTNDVASSSLAYPMAPGYFLVPLGCGITTLRMLFSSFGPPPEETAAVH